MYNSELIPRQSIFKKKTKRRGGGKGGGVLRRLKNRQTGPKAENTFSRTKNLHNTGFTHIKY